MLSPVLHTFLNLIIKFWIHFGSCGCQLPIQGTDPCISPCHRYNTVVQCFLVEIIHRNYEFQSFSHFYRKLQAGAKKLHRSHLWDSNSCEIFHKVCVATRLRCVANLLLSLAVTNFNNKLRYRRWTARRAASLSNVIFCIAVQQLKDFNWQRVARSLCGSGASCSKQSPKDAIWCYPIHKTLKTKKLQNRKKRRNRKLGVKRKTRLTDTRGVDVGGVGVQCVLGLTPARSARDWSSDSRTTHAVRSATCQSQTRFVH